jgi:histidinol-phosphatase (PHP family)
MLPDYHIHTTLCKHAEGEPASYRKEAFARQMPEICLTDHCPNPDGYDPENRMGLTEFALYRDMVAELQDGRAPTILFGLEADYYEGCEIFLRKWLPVQGFDLVLGSIHYIEDWGFDNPAERHVWDSVDITTTWKMYFARVQELAGSGLFDVVGHLDLPKKFGHRPPERALKEMVQPALDTIAKAGMGLELNTSGLRRPVREIYPSPLILSMARERDIPICFGSDAHTFMHVGEGFSLALKLAREVGYTHYFRMRKRKKEFIPLPGV